MNDMTPVTTAKDWASDQEVRWCPGCGDYAVLKAVQRTMPDLGVAREKTVLRDQFLVDAKSLTKVSGHPFRIAEIEAAIESVLA